jgi:osmotically-inducible protein OsmY
MHIGPFGTEQEQLMSRNFIPYLSLALGAAMIAGAPATSYGSEITSVIRQSPAQGTGSPTTEQTTRDASPSTAASTDLGDRIEQAWATNKDLADADIAARVEGATVILEGKVQSAALRQTAERLARRVKGVSRVDNQIALHTSAAPTNNEREGTSGSVLVEDTKDAARTAGRKTEDATRTAADKTEDAVEKSGEAVGTAARKTGSALERAAEATRDAVVTGARKTKDAVTDAPEKIDETWITSKIAAQINADDALEDVDVDVKVDSNVVTISGPVPSTALRDRVLRIARDTKGVSRVVDRMTITGGGR